MSDAVILYDDDCGFCRWALAKILARDRHGRLRAVALQDREADALLGGMDEGRKMASWHLVAPDGRVFSAGAGVAPLARLLPGGTPVALLASLAPSLTERAYQWVARNRERLGARLGAERCAVRPAGAPPASAPGGGDAR